MDSEQDPDKYKHNKLADEIIGAFYEVYNALGYGFLESIYQKALLYKLKQNNRDVEEAYPIYVYFEDITVGEFYADLVVDDRVILELKAANEIVSEHEAQLLNYLNATKFEVGLLLNFGPEPQVRRKAFDNENKTYRID